MGLFSRIWGKGYNNRVSLFLLANALCVVILIPKIMPIPFLDKISFVYLAITFLLVNKRFKLICIAIFETWGMIALIYGGAKFNAVIGSLLDVILSGLGLREIVSVEQYNSLIAQGSAIIMRSYFISTFIVYSGGILMIFLVTSLIIDWKFKIRKRAGLQ